MSIGVLSSCTVGSSFDNTVGSLTNIASIAGGAFPCGLVESSAEGVYIIADVVNFVLPSSTGYIYHVAITKIVKFKTLVAAGAPSCIKIEILAKWVNGQTIAEVDVVAGRAGLVQLTLATYKLIRFKAFLAFLRDGVVL